VVLGEEWSLAGHWEAPEGGSREKWLCISYTRKIVHQCVWLSAQGTIEATAQTEQYDGSWLGMLSGKGATGSWLFASTDKGIARVELQHGQLVQTRVFPDAEPFVDSGSHLCAGQQERYVIDRQNIY
jgi:hypothetical protein